MKDSKTEKKEMETMLSCTQMLDKLAFTTQFKAIPNGLKSLTTDMVYKPEEIKVINFYRFEGESNPSDSTIMYAIETSTGERGTLTDAYGPYSDTNVTSFMNDVNSIEKKVNKNETI
jgi:hypothetical protein